MPDPLDLTSRVSVLETSVKQIHEDVSGMRVLLQKIANTTGRPNLAFWAILVTVLIAAGGGILTIALAGISAAYTLQSKENDRTHDDLVKVWETIGRQDQRVQSKFRDLDEIDSESLRDRTKAKADMVEAETQFRYQEMLIGVLWKKATGDELPMPPFRNP